MHRQRPATSADVPAITAIYRHWVLHGTATFEIDPPDEAEMRRRLEGITGAGYPYLVGVDGGDRVLGYAYANVYRPRIAYRATVEDSIYVHPDATNSGVGTALLDSLIGDCNARGYRQMVAVIGDSAQTASIRLHQSLGFTFVGTLHAVGYKFDRWLDSVFMQRALGSGDSTPFA
jgi:phosphinothricin acetyltransferase